MAKELTGKTDRRKGTGLWVVVQFLFANLFGVFLAVVVFGILPGLQIVTGGNKKMYDVREVTNVTEPPPPDTVEEEPPPPEESQDEPPPPAPNLQPMSLSAALDSISPVGGSGAGMLPAVGGQMMEGLMDSMAAGMEQKPTPVSQVAPKIPATLGRQRLSGRIEVEFVVDAQGRVQNPRVVRSFNTLLNGPVLDAIRQWRFKPGMRGNKAVPMKTKMPFKFDS